MDEKTLIRQCSAILAECCKKNLSTLTQTEVYNVTIKKDERPNEIYAVAKMVPYEGLSQKIKGSFILGFVEEPMALFVAAAIGKQMGLPPVTEMGDVASDILAEFMNIIVGNTVSKWDELGFKVKFSPAVAIEYGKIPEKAAAETEAYMIILQLKINFLVFRVTFTRIVENKLRGKRILLVDDSSMIRSILSNILKQREADVIVSEDGRDALEKHRILKPDLTIMDINMPKMDGLEAIFQIKTTNPAAKFIVLSSSTRQDEVVTAKTLKVNAYVIKPFKTEDFLATIDRVMNT